MAMHANHIVLSNIHHSDRFEMLPLHLFFFLERTLMHSSFESSWVRFISTIVWLLFFLMHGFFCKRAFYQKSAAAALAFAACSPFLVMMRTKTSSHSLDRIGQLPFRAAPEPIVWKWKIAFYCMHPIFELKRDFHKMNEGKAQVWPTIVSSIGQRQAPLTPIQNSFTLTPN